MAGEETQSADRMPVLEQIAVGILAAERDTDGLLRTILRATERGFDVLVTPEVTADAVDERLHFARELGATIVPSTHGGRGDVPRDRLVEYARANGYDGLLYIRDPQNRTDFARTVQKFDAGRFAVDAIPVDERDPDAARILVGIPAYNEAGTIGDVVESTRRYADEVVVVDDGSEDGTADLARAAGAAVIEHDRNRGYGAALKALFRRAADENTDHLVVLDADGQHDPEDIPALLEHQRRQGSEVVIGSRGVAGGSSDAPVHRRIGLALVNGLTNLSLGLLRSESRIRDTQSGFRIYDRRAIEFLATAPGIGDSMSASVDILYQADRADFDIAEVPTTVHYSVDNASTHRPIAHGMILGRNLIRLIERDRPISALGLPGLLLTFVGLAFGLWTVQAYVQTGGVFRYGLAIAATLFVLAGFLMSFMAIVLHSLNSHRHPER